MPKKYYPNHHAYIELPYFTITSNTRVVHIECIMFASYRSSQHTSHKVNKPFENNGVLQFYQFLQMIRKSTLECFLKPMLLSHINYSLRMCGNIWVRHRETFYIDGGTLKYVCLDFSLFCAFFYWIFLIGQSHSFLGIPISSKV